MALGDPYATLAELKSYLKDTLTVDDDELNDALGSVSEEIEDHTHRQFNKVTVASARLIPAEMVLTATLAYVYDFHTTTGLIVETDEGGNGTFDTTWASTDYQMEPVNGIVAGRAGWPFYRIRAVNGRRFPCHRRASLQVTAQWGWDAVPAPIKQATLILASETFKLKDAPFGVAGFGDMGVVRVRDNPIAKRKLAPYVLDPVMVG